MLDAFKKSGFYSATMHIDDVIEEVLNGDLPVEFCNEKDKHINLRHERHWDAKDKWALPILLEAKKRLASYLEMDPDCQAHHKKDIRQFSMRRHNYLLTQSMHEAGWRQWQSTVNTMTKEEAEELGVKFKSRRYACHFWVGPNKEIVFGKIKLEGKHVPVPFYFTTPTGAGKGCGQ